ncbi:hypothetical protein M9Y10_001692 [Tritrichomonas musculus]|uniref:F5/8 type C domain-containing protein n=1 Tax=Tritrichomonas musculus TaxID=1915356 RepID=A0ABR2L7Q7_9EUKA
MIEKNQIKLETSTILNVPFQMYDKDFTFIVNGEEFQTCRIVADILSPKISANHITDPTINQYSITTREKGDFSFFLQLLNFNEIDIPKTETKFISEIIENLGNESIIINDKDIEGGITNDNVFELINKHENSHFFYSKYISGEIEFISSHFFEIVETHQEEMMNLPLEILERILMSDKLRLKSEDQLLNFLNNLYKNSNMYSNLYEYVQFLNVSQKTMIEFLSIFDFNDITKQIWIMLLTRLEQTLNKPIELVSNRNRYNSIGTPILYERNKEFDGIFNYLRKTSNGNISEELNITSSSIDRDDDSWSDQNVILFDDQNKYFASKDLPNSWLCFDFKERRVIPKNYTIRSYIATIKYGCHPKSWVIEGSDDNEQWIAIDEQNDCPFINGNNLVYTFTILNPRNKAFKYIRMRQTNKSWNEHDHLCVNSFELYGLLI